MFLTNRVMYVCTCTYVYIYILKTILKNINTNNVTYGYTIILSKKIVADN